MRVVYILIAVLACGVLIADHELGHFLVARLCGVRVNEFSIGMGPALFKKQGKDTLYALRLIPIGGYCAMEGEDGDSGDPRSFTSAKWWKRLIILCAGAFMNLVTGFLVMVLLFGCFYQLPTSAKVTGFMEGNVVEAQGLQAGDVLYAINGRRIYMQSDFNMLEQRLTTDRCDLTVLRGGEKITLENFNLTRAELTDSAGNTGMYLGIYFGEHEEKNLLTVNKYAALQCIDFTRMVWYGLQDLVSGRVGMREIGGPAMIVNAMVESGKAAPSVLDGILNVLYIGAFIAVNLAVMNLLPIPALDGGRVLFLLINTAYTGITKKKIDPKYEGWIHGGAMILLLGFMAFIFVKDIWQLIAG